MIILQTERLTLSHMDAETDAEFVLRLLNEPSFIRFIGDKGVHTLEDARQYILTGPVASYEKNRFGLFLVQLKHSFEKIGMCGLIKRGTLRDVDIGFAIVPEFWNQGYAFEAATAVVNHANKALGIKRIVAITDPTNDASARVLGKLGLTFERLVDLGDGKPVKLFVPAANDNKGTDQSGNK